MYNYKQALQSGATEDQVIDYLTKTRKFDVQGAIQAGANKQQIIEYLSNTKQFTPVQEQPKPQTTLGKIANNPVTKAFEKTANFLFGSTAKTVGGMITGGIGDAKYLKGYATGDKQEMAEGQKLQAVRDENITKANTVFTAIELYPGGGIVTSYLKKLPFGEQIAKSFMKMPEAIKSKAVEQYSKILSATKDTTKRMTQKIAPELVERGVTTTSLKSLGEKAATEMADANALIKQFEDNLSPFAKTEITPTLDTLKTMRQKYIVNGKVVDQNAVQAIDNTMLVLAQFGDQIPTKDFIKIKRLTDKAVAMANKNFTKDEGLSLATEARETMVNAMRNQLNMDYPDLAAMNREFHLWSNTKYVVDQALKRKTSQAGGLGKIITSTGGAAAGFSQGETITDKLEKTVTGFFLGNMAAKFFTSPAYRSVSAVNKNRLANLMADGKLDEAAFLISKLSAGLKNSIDQPEDKER